LAGQDPDAAADPAALLPSMDELLELHVGGKAAAGGRPGDVVKVGEGTFGEAFRVGGSVVKVVPIDGGALAATGEVQKTAGELLAEAEIALALTSLRAPLAPTGGGCVFGTEDGAPDATAGFAATTAVGVCHGAYAGSLVRAWRAWRTAHGSDNPDPGTAFPRAGQAFVLLFGSDGGADLEHWSPASAGEVRSVLLQATLALAVAERALAFEHRDLHWGNILIARTPPGAPPPAARLAGADIAVPGAAGLAVTLIDFTLSRLAADGGGVAYCDLNADPALFAGPRGDAQAETYRRMRRAVRGDWAAHAPATNALWLHYLADVFVAAKAPPPGAGPDEGRALRGFRRRALGAPSAGALLHDEYFAGEWVARAPRGGGA
jgi:serine/threonine-protein kinase haspin